MRSFGLIFGNTTSAVAWVLAVFLGGLAIGSALAARRPSRDPLRDYARVELAVGATALVTAAAAGAALGVRRARRAQRRLGSGRGRRPGLSRGARAARAHRPARRDGAARARVPRARGASTCAPASAGCTCSARSAVPRDRARRIRADGGGRRARDARRRGRRQSLRGRRRAALVSRDRRPRRPDSRQRPPPSLAPSGQRVARAGARGRLGRRDVRRRGALDALARARDRLVQLRVPPMLLAVLLGIALGLGPSTRGGARRIARPARAASRLFACAGLGCVAGQWMIGRLPSVWLAASAAARLLRGPSGREPRALPRRSAARHRSSSGCRFPMLLHLAEVRPGAAQHDGGPSLRLEHGRRSAGARS